MTARLERWWDALHPMVRFDLRRPARVWRAARARGLAWPLVLGLVAVYAYWVADMLRPDQGSWTRLEVLAWGWPAACVWLLVGLAPFTANLLTQDREKQRLEAIGTIPQSDRDWLWGRLATPLLIATLAWLLLLPPLLLGTRHIDHAPWQLGPWLVCVPGAAAAAVAFGLLAALHCRTAAQARAAATVAGLLTWFLAVYLVYLFTYNLDPPDASGARSALVCMALAVVALGLLAPLTLRHAQRNFARLWRYRPDRQVGAARVGLVGARHANPVVDRELGATRRRQRWFGWLYGLALAGVGVWLATRDAADGQDVWLVITIVHLSLLLSMALVLSLAAAASIAGERDRNTWESLLATPLQAGTVIWGKLAAILLPTRWPLLGTLVVVAIHQYLNPTDALGAEAAAPMLGIAALLVAVGLSTGLRSRSTATATSTLLLTLMVLWYGLMVVAMATAYGAQYPATAGESRAHAAAFLLALLPALALVDSSVARLELVRDGRVSWRPRAWLLLGVLFAAVASPPEFALLPAGILLSIGLIHADDALPLPPGPRWWQLWWHAPATGLAFVLVVCGVLAVASQLGAQPASWAQEAWLAIAVFAGTLEWARPRIRRPVPAQALAAGSALLALFAALPLQARLGLPSLLATPLATALAMVPFVLYVMYQQHRPHPSRTETGGPALIA